MDDDEDIFKIMKEIGIMLYDTWGNSLEDLYRVKKCGKKKP